MPCLKHYIQSTTSDRIKMTTNTDEEKWNGKTKAQ